MSRCYAVAPVLRRKWLWLRALRPLRGSRVIVCMSGREVIAEGSVRVCMGEPA